MWLRLNNLRVSFIVLMGARDEGIEPIDGGAHDLEIFLRALKLAFCAFAIEQAHRILNGVRLLEDV